jgi:hypothetical protein
LVPDFNHTILTAGFQFGNMVAPAARTSDGQTIIAYLPTRRTVSINLAKISAPSAKAWWFNPQTALSTFIAEFPTTSAMDFTSPDQNDWVLVIDAASAHLSAPGVTPLSW